MKCVLLPTSKSQQMKDIKYNVHWLYLESTGSLITTIIIRDIELQMTIFRKVYLSLLANRSCTARKHLLFRQFQCCSPVQCKNINSSSEEEEAEGSSSSVLDSHKTHHPIGEKVNWTRSLTSSTQVQIPRCLNKTNWWRLQAMNKSRQCGRIWKVAFFDEEAYSCQMLARKWEEGILEKQTRKFSWMQDFMTKRSSYCILITMWICNEYSYLVIVATILTLVLLRNSSL